MNKIMLHSKIMNEN